ncbi:MAG: hypothetical protein ACE364_05360 [Chlorobiota bacterium]
MKIEANDPDCFFVKESSIHKLGNKDKYKKILNVIILGISIFLIEFIVQLLLIVIMNKLFLNYLFSGHINNPLVYNNETLVWGAKNVFYLRMLFFLPIWILTFIPGNSIINMKNQILSLIIYNLFMLIMTMVITSPVSILFFFSPFVYYLALSIIITPIIIYTIPYFRNFLEGMVEE